MAYTAWSVVFGEQPSAAKWNILGTHYAHFYTYTGEGTNAIQQMKHTNYSAVATTTTLIPNDDTIPQITEGGEFMTQAITPLSATNLLVIEVQALLSSTSNSQWFALAIFQDSTANALAVGGSFEVTGTAPILMTAGHSMAAGTTSSTTFRVRAGGNLAGTTTFNGTSGASRWGATTKSFIRVTEYKV